MLIKKYDLKRGVYSFYRRLEIILCTEELVKIFEIPDYVTGIEIQVHTAPAKDRVEIKRISGDHLQRMVDGVVTCFYPETALLIDRLLGNRKAIYVEIQYEEKK